MTRWRAPATVALVVAASLALGACGGARNLIVSRAEQQRIRTAAIVTSRVVDSPYYANCVDQGVAVWVDQYGANNLGGPLMAAAGRRTDQANARKLNDLLRNYDFETLLADKMYDELSRIAPYTIIAEEEVDELRMPERYYRIGRETVRRKSDYRTLARQLEADAIIDLRVVEWALVKLPISNDVKLRLRLRVKVIKFPENELFFENEFLNEIDPRPLGLTIESYMGNYGGQLKSETALAIDAIVRNILRQILV